MTKKKLNELAKRLKEVSLTSRQFTLDKIEASKLNMIEKGTPNAGYLKTIIFALGVTEEANVVRTGAGKNYVGEINIPKDFLVTGVKRCTVVEGTGADAGRYFVTKENGITVTSYEAPAAVDAAGLWAIFTVNVKVDSLSPESNEYLCVNLSELIDIYTAGNGIEIVGNVVSVKIDSSNANGLGTTASGLKLALATRSAAGAQSAAGKAQEEDIASDLTLMTTAEIISWFGYDPTKTTTAGTPEKALADNFAAAGFDDSLTDEA
jgi:hypothetical protein